MIAPVVPDTGSALLGIEQPVAEWRRLQLALDVGLGAVHLRDRHGGATARTLIGFRRLLSQVVRHDGRDEMSAATMTLPRAEWQCLEAAARDAAIAATSPTVSHRYRLVLAAAIPHLVVFADELARAAQDIGATACTIRCAERQASVHP